MTSNPVDLHLPGERLHRIFVRQTRAMDRLFRFILVVIIFFSGSSGEIQERIEQSELLLNTRVNLHVPFQKMRPYYTVGLIAHLDQNEGVHSKEKARKRDSEFQIPFAQVFVSTRDTFIILLYSSGIGSNQFSRPPPVHVSIV